MSLPSAEGEKKLPPTRISMHEKEHHGRKRRTCADFTRLEHEEILSRRHGVLLVRKQLDDGPGFRRGDGDVDLHGDQTNARTRANISQEMRV